MTQPDLVAEARAFEFTAHSRPSEAIATLHILVIQLADEVERLERERYEFMAMTGCGTGDCPHGSVQECCDALANNLAGSYAEIERLRNDEKIAGIVRQLWEDWSCGYDALASHQWDLLKTALGEDADA